MKQPSWLLVVAAIGVTVGLIAGVISVAVWQEVAEMRTPEKTALRW